MIRLSVRTTSREQLLDITREVQRAVTESGVTDGSVVVFVPHTTAAATINENADPDVVTDLLQGLALIAPHHQPFYRHDEGNSDAHIKCSLVGSSVTVLIEGGRLALGTWQSIYFAEFDGPRSREVWLRIGA